MTPNEFNDKWKDHLADGHYGMAIYQEDIVDYVDQQFEKEEKTNPYFKYFQIKVKWDSICIYTEGIESQKVNDWEVHCQKLLK